MACLESQPRCAVPAPDAGRTSPAGQRSDLTLPAASPTAARAPAARRSMRLIDQTWSCGEQTRHCHTDMQLRLSDTRHECWVGRRTNEGTEAPRHPLRPAPDDCRRIDSASAVLATTCSGFSAASAAHPEALRNDLRQLGDPPPASLRESSLSRSGATSAPGPLSGHTHNECHLLQGGLHGSGYGGRV